MCGGRIYLLQDGVIHTGVIVREETGHRFYKDARLAEMREMQKKFKALEYIKTTFVPVEIIIGDREKIRARIKELNRIHGLPGVGLEMATA